MERQGKLYQELAVYLHKVVKMIDTAANQAIHESTGLTLSRYLVLNSVGPSTGKRLSQQSIAGLLGIDEAAVSRQVVELVRDGLIERRYSEHSRREYALALTDKGAETLMNCRKSLSKAVAPHFMAAGSEGAVTLVEVLKTIHNSLAKSTNKLT